MKHAEILQLLPYIFQRTANDGLPGGDLLLALLDVMEGLHAPDEMLLGQIETYFDPYAVPDRFVAYLSSWVDLDRFLIDVGDQPEGQLTLISGIGRLRELISSSALLSRWRGTSYGLRQFLEIATGIKGFQIEESGDEDFHILIRAPQAAEAYRSLIVQIIEQEKPAHVTYDLTFTT